MELIRSKPVFDYETRNPQKVFKVIRNANCAHCNGLCGNQRISTPNLAPCLAKVLLNEKRLPGRLGIERGNPHHLEAGLKGYALCLRLTGTGDTRPDFNGGLRRYSEGAPRCGDDALANIVVSRLCLE